MKYKGLLFDLDGVLVDTAKYHYLAWKQMAEKLGIAFTEQDNERLKGVSRMRSFEIILEIGGVEMTQEEKARCCREKNDVYVEFIRNMPKEELFPGVREFLEDARGKGYRIALGSASKNSGMILSRLEITDLFDAIIDGTKVSKAKPDPEVFLKGTEELGVLPAECIVFEDAVAGIQAAHSGGMVAVGVGLKDRLPEADTVIPGFKGKTVEDIIRDLHA